ncbi:FG-GAP-like repeat-containing protein [Streptomyces sp. NBC_00708]
MASGTMAEASPGGQDKPAGAAVRSTPAPLDITPNWRTAPRGEVLTAVGPAGFAHAPEDADPAFGDTYEWTPFGSGESLPLGYGDTNDSFGYFGVESDLVVDHQGYDIVLRNGVTGAATELTLPQDDSFEALAGNSVLVRAQSRDSDDNLVTQGWYLLPADGDQSGRVPVTGWPAGVASGRVKLLAGDADALVLAFPSSPERGDNDRLGLLDLATGAMRVLTADSFRSAALSPGSLAWTDRERRVHVLDRAALDAPEQILALPEGLDGSRIGLLDGWILAPEDVTGTDGDLQRGLVALSVDGKRRVSLLDKSGRGLVSMPGDKVAVVGGTSATDWQLKEISAGADGVPVTKDLHRVAPVPATVQALALSAGVLSTVELDGPQGAGFYNRSLGLAPGEPAAGAPSWTGKETGRDYDYTVCGQRPCTQLYNSGDGRSVYQVRNYQKDPQVEIVARRSPTEAARALTGNFDGRLTDSFGRYAVYQGGRPTVEGMLVPDDRTIVVDLDAAAGSSVVLEQPQTAASVWGETLFTGTGTNGLVTRTDLTTLKQTGTVETGAPCELAELQTAGDWLYWACEQYTRHGAVNLRTGVKIDLPGYGGSGLLGDGFFVQHQYAAAELRLTTFQSGTVATRYLGVRVGSGSNNRRAAYSVDRFGGGIAYVDTEGMMHVAQSGEPASPLSAVTAHTPGALTAPAGWKGSWWLSKPAASWKLTLRNTASGATVRTLTGGEARGQVTAAWDGKTASGAHAPNGSYTWTLTATPADGVGAALTTSGTVKLTGGAAVARDLVKNDGFGDLLAFTSAGKADWRAGTGTGAGRVEDKVSGTGWTGGNTVTAAVPFEDISGDRCNDVLVRTKAGELRAYKPGCGAALKPTTPYTKIGTGWNMFDALTSPGDMSGDGRADLLGRTPAGDLYFYRGKGNGLFEPRVKIGYGWQGYLLAGMGDMDGDGRGDLLARDRAGDVWRYPATVNGTLGTRTKIGYGWTMYDTMVGSGDLNGDGRADLLARDTSGVLWSYRGDGKGALAARTKVGGSWQTYKNLF